MYFLKLNIKRAYFWRAQVKPKKTFFRIHFRIATRKQDLKLINQLQIYRNIYIFFKFFFQFYFIFFYLFFVIFRFLFIFYIFFFILILFSVFFLIYFFPYHRTWSCHDHWIAFAILSHQLFQMLCLSCPTWRWPERHRCPGA